MAIPLREEYLPLPQEWLVFLFEKRVIYVVQNKMTTIYSCPHCPYRLLFRVDGMVRAHSMALYLAWTFEK